MIKRDRECLEKCIEESKACIQKEGRNKKCTVDYSECLTKCRLRAE